MKAKQNKGTTGSERHDVAIMQKMTTQKTIPCKRRKAKQGYKKHKKSYDE